MVRLYHPWCLLKRPQVNNRSEILVLTCRRGQREAQSPRLYAALRKECGILTIVQEVRCLRYHFRMLVLCDALES